MIRFTLSLLAIATAFLSVVAIAHSAPRPAPAWDNHSPKLCAMGYVWSSGHPRQDVCRFVVKVAR